MTSIAMLSHIMSSHTATHHRYLHNVTIILQVKYIYNNAQKIYTFKLAHLCHKKYQPVSCFKHKHLAQQQIYVYHPLTFKTEHSDPCQAKQNIYLVA